MRRVCLPLLLAAGIALTLASGADSHEKETDDHPEGEGALSAIHCDDGRAGDFPCWNTDLLAWLPRDVLGLGPGNDVWGWMDARTGVAYALVGMRQGLAFVRLADPEDPEYVGFLPTQTFASTWRDVKVHADHAFVVSEARGHGLQVFDLTRLDAVQGPPIAFEPTAHYAAFGNAHNLALNEETGFAYAVGSDTCFGGPHAVDVSRPTEPRFAGCFTDDGYTHDAQCVIYRGPDARYREREICFNSNEDSLTLADVSAKDAPRLLARGEYPGRGYTHQGWLTEDHAYFLVGDELDERRFGHNTRTWIWDVSDLEAPFVAGHYDGAQRAVDHNIQVRGDHAYEANYRAGLRVLRIGDLSRGELVEVAHLDTYPEDDQPSFSGAWGVYVFPETGIALVSDVNRGLFVLHPHVDAVPECGDGIDNDRDGLRDADDPACDIGSRESPRNDVAIAVAPRPWRRRLPTPAHGAIRVAVLGEAGFDVASIDPGSLGFGPALAPPKRSPRLRDVNRDGIVDLVAHYRLDLAGVTAAELACLHWQTHAGTPYAGCAPVPPQDRLRATGGRQPK